MLRSCSPIYFTTLLFLSLLYFACDGCEQDELVRGCRISQGHCFCGVGCDTDYRFSTREECRAALTGDAYGCPQQFTACWIAVKFCSQRAGEPGTPNCPSRWRSQDVCTMNPCHNNGACIQTPSSYMKFKCRCEGTGFYGPKCQYPCPSSGSAAAKNFPFECIEI